MNHKPRWWRRILGAAMIGLGQAIGMPLRNPFRLTVSSPELLDDDDEEAPFHVRLLSNDGEDGLGENAEQQESIEAVTPRGSRRLDEPHGV